MRAPINQRTAKSRFAAILAIFAAVSLTTTGVGIATSYSAAYERSRNTLIADVQHYAEIAGSVAHVVSRDSVQFKQRSVDAFSRMVHAWSRDDRFGEGSTFAIARRDGNNISFILGEHRAHGQYDGQTTGLPWSNVHAPMRKALLGESGTMITHDCNNEETLAAFAPAKSIDAGIVGLVTLAEIRAPYVRAAVIALSVGFVLMLVGSTLCIRLQVPVLRSFQESEERLRAIVNSTIDAIITIDAKGITRSFNPAAEKLFGYSADDIIGQNINCIVPEPDRSRHDSYLKNKLDAGRGRIVGLEREVVAERRDGTQFPVDLSVSEVVLDSERLYVGILRDITERKTAMANLTEAKAQADAANKAKSSFLANMSHEIRTPLNAILGFAETLIDSSTTANDKHSATGAIKKSSSRLMRIVNDVLDISAMEAGKLEVNIAACTPARILSAVETDVSPHAKLKGLYLEIEQSSELPEVVLSDEQRLRQIITYLAENAIKFTDRGGVRIALGFEPEVHEHGSPQQPATLTFDVIDTGMGIAAEMVERIFEPLTQTDESTTRRFGGTGLGLAISRHLAAMLGGELILSSTTPSAGSHFKVRIPVGTAPSKAKPKTPGKTAQPEPDPEPLRAGTVLIVEDEEMNQRLFAMILRKAGANVTIAENGKLGVEHALRALENGKPYDAILMDLQMPVMGGIDATIAIRKQGYAAPIMALTADNQAETKKKCLSSGFDGFATKPISQAKLISLINQYTAEPVST